MTIRSSWLTLTGQTRADTRLAPTGTMLASAELTSRSGVIPGGNPFAASGTGMQVTIGTGRAVIQGGTTQGAYPMVITASESRTIADGHASLARIDSVILRVYDTLFDASGQTAVAMEVIQGTPASSPVAPSLPSTTSLRLWNITVPAGASAGSPINWGTALSDQRSYTVGIGGIRPGGAVNGSYDGELREQSGRVERWSSSSSAWVPYPSQLGGIAPSSLSPGSYTGQYRDNASGLPDRWNGSAWVAAGASGTWTPAWSTATGSAVPRYGNATVSAFYFQLGKMVLYGIDILFGSTTNFGSSPTTADNWTFSLPVTCAFSGSGRTVGTAVFTRSNTEMMMGYAYPGTTTALQVNIATGRVDAVAPSTNGAVDSLTPFTWANGDRLRISGFYPAA